MIIGTKSVDFSALKKACSSVEALQAFTLSLVPTPLRHLESVIDNQKYFVALQVRAIQSLSWKRRKELCEGLLKGARIKGTPYAFYDYSDLLLEIDREAFQRYIREDAARAER